MWSAWWICWRCLKAVHVPTTGWADTCACGAKLVPMLAPATPATLVKG